VESKQAAVEALMNSRRDKDFMIGKSSFFSREREHLARLSEGEQINGISCGAAIREARFTQRCRSNRPPGLSSRAVALLILAFSQGRGMDACPYSVAVRVESQTPSVPDGLPLVGGFTQIFFNPTDLHFRPFTFLEQVHHPSQVLLIHF
jgi:hypothetical protein